MKHRFGDDVKDRCDFAYVAGALTVAIDGYRSNQNRPIRSPLSMCPQLANELKRIGVLKI